ncbi:NUDIX hydrolase [Ornithinimicrobium cryptoxanthini]|uniref:NUDIX hydrolase n=1 Tax=Ornithinimicrobium cryptoxanthini TaxID=2934161 RepID=UPI002117E6C5|nr:CoA pyrophosphatase [Ornithinimicrobium cryptoxanthini]
MSSPLWLGRMAGEAAGIVIGEGDRLRPPVGQPGARRSAVLLLFSDVQSGAQDAPGSGTSAGVMSADAAPAASAVSILLTERAHHLRSHPGQVSFPGGRKEASDPDLVATALRETHEEVGVDPDSVEVAGMLPPLHLEVSSHDVSPVLGWWRHPGAAWARDPGEVARVLQVPVADLVDPTNRFSASHPSGWVGPAFQAQGLVVWGFTAILLDGVLRLGGWELPWDRADVRPAPITGPRAR